jgi:DNA-binding NtrC family response regulator
MKKKLNTIIIIEDEQVFRNLLSMYLAPYQTFFATTLKEGRRLLSDNLNADLLVLDLGLPDSVHRLSSYLHIRTFRKRLPIIIYSDHVDDDMINITESDVLTWVKEKSGIRRREDIEDHLKEMGFALKDFNNWQKRTLRGDYEPY